MKCVRAVICSLLLLLIGHQQVICYTEDDLAEALWSDTSNMLRRSEMNEICRFLLREGTSDIGRRRWMRKIQSLNSRPSEVNLISGHSL